MRRRGGHRRTNIVFEREIAYTGKKYEMLEASV